MGVSTDTSSGCTIGPFSRGLYIPDTIQVCTPYATFNFIQKKNDQANARFVRGTLLPLDNGLELP